MFERGESKLITKMKNITTTTAAAAAAAAAEQTIRLLQFLCFPHIDMIYLITNSNIEVTLEESIFWQGFGFLFLFLQTLNSHR
jgi:cobalamin biosynthesis protein CbiD